MEPRNVLASRWWLLAWGLLGRRRYPPLLSIMITSLQICGKYYIYCVILMSRYIACHHKYGGGESGGRGESGGAKKILRQGKIGKEVSPHLTANHTLRNLRQS